MLGNASTLPPSPLLIGLSLLVVVLAHLICTRLGVVALAILSSLCEGDVVLVAVADPRSILPILMVLQSPVVALAIFLTVPILLVRPLLISLSYLAYAWYSRFSITLSSQNVPVVLLVAVVVLVLSVLDMVLILPVPALHGALRPNLRIVGGTGLFEFLANAPAHLAFKALLVFPVRLVVTLLIVRAVLVPPTHVPVLVSLFLVRILLIDVGVLVLLATLARTLLVLAVAVQSSPFTHCSLLLPMFLIVALRFSSTNCQDTTLGDSVLVHRPHDPDKALLWLITVARGYL